MRILWVTLLLGCGFEHGRLGGVDSTGDARSSRDVSVQDDVRGACTTHALPPSIDVDPAAWSASFLSAPAWNCNAAGTTTIDSNAGTAVSTSCALGTVELTNDVAQVSGPPVLVVRLAGLTVTNGHVLRLVGDKPIVVLVAGDVVVDSGGLVDAGARAATPGAGGSRAGQCIDLATGLGTAPSGAGWGAGGGGFGTAGGQGCYNITNGGSANGDAMLQPLRGGCSGGLSGGPNPGAGGGAFEISASGSISVGATGLANLSAGGGGAPGSATGGGNGGGSGGAILLVSPALATLGATGALRANGGAGSAGCSSSCGGGNEAGDDGHATDSSRSTDTSGIAGGGNNADHGRRGGLADLVGSSAIVTGAGELATPQTGGRGGGGGGGGRVVLMTAAAATACD